MKRGSAIAASRARISSTTRISISVKPASAAELAACSVIGGHIGGTERGRFRS